MKIKSVKPPVKRTEVTSISASKQYGKGPRVITAKEVEFSGDIYDLNFTKHVSVDRFNRLHNSNRDYNYNIKKAYVYEFQESNRGEKNKSRLKCSAYLLLEDGTVLVCGYERKRNYQLKSKVNLVTVFEPGWVTFDTDFNPDYHIGPLDLTDVDVPKRRKTKSVNAQIKERLLFEKRYQNR